MDTSQTSIALATQQTQAPTKASVVVDLRPFSELKTRFKKLVSSFMDTGSSGVASKTVCNR